MSWAMLAAGAGGVALGLIGIVLAFARMRPVALAVSVAAVVLALVAFGGGFVGRSLGRSVVDDVLAAVDPDVRDELRTQGYAEAAQCISVGGWAGAGPAIVGTAALALAVLRKKNV